MVYRCEEPAERLHAGNVLRQQRKPEAGQAVELSLVGCALLLSLWVLPRLVGALTPVSPKRLLSVAQDALVTAFATGSLLIVLPLLVERLKELLPEAGIEGQEADSAVDLVVPINFNLPNMGKLMSLAFVPFAGWFAGTEIGAEQLPLFLVSGLLSFFGEVVVALPFLLELMHVPADMFELFLAVDIFTDRFGTLLAGVHTVALAALTAAGVSGQLRVSWSRLGRFAIVSTVLTVSLFVGLRVFFEVLVPQEYHEYQKLVSMGLAVNRLESRSIALDELRPARTGPGQRLAAIRQRGVLRVGYPSDSLPFVCRNEAGETVGLEADLAHLLAGELDVALEFVRVPRDEIGDLLAAGKIDIMVGGLLMPPQRALEMQFTAPYLESTLALIVPDHERGRFDSNPRLQRLESVTGAVVNLPYYTNTVQRALPNLEVIALDSPRQFFRAEAGRYDALVFSAEAGSAWTLIYPRFSVVVQKPRTVSTPIGLALPTDASQLAAFVDTWLLLQREAGVLEQLRGYWILGEGAASKSPRWSIIRNVLGWMD